MHIDDEKSVAYVRDEAAELFFAVGQRLLGPLTLDDILNRADDACILVAGASFILIAVVDEMPKPVYDIPIMDRKNADTSFLPTE